MALSEEHIDAIHSALEAADGNIRIATTFINELGWDWTESKMYATINQNTALRIRWGSQSEIVSSPPPQSQTDAVRPVHIQDPEAVMSAMERQEENLRSTLQKLGRSEAEIDQALAARDLQANFALQTLAVMGGSTAEIAMWIKDDIRKIRDELNGQPADGKRMLHDREKMLREDRTALAGAFINCSDRLTKGVMVQMEAKKRIKEEKDKHHKKQQPRSIGVTANAGGKVVVIQQKA